MKGKAVPTTTALDREALNGSWPSSHPIQRSRLFFATTALDPEILAGKDLLQKDLLHPSRKANFLITMALDPETLAK